MNAKTSLPKLLAIGGTGLVWFPLLAPVLIALLVAINEGVFRLDYLMPAELSPSALLGGGLLAWAAFLTRARRRLVLGSLGGALAMLAAVLVLPVVTGLATGQTAPEGWPMAVVLGALGLFTVALMILGVGGILLLRDLFRPAAPPNVATPQ